MQASGTGWSTAPVTSPPLVAQPTTPKYSLITTSSHSSLRTLKMPRGVSCERFRRVFMTLQKRNCTPEGFFGHCELSQAALGQIVLVFAAAWFSSRHEALGMNATEPATLPQNLIYVSKVLFPIFHPQVVFRILDLFCPAAGEFFLHVDFHFDQHSFPSLFSHSDFIFWSFELRLHTFASRSFAAAAYQ